MADAHQDEPHVSRYHPHRPPFGIYAILSAFTKFMRDPVYRKHGGCPDNNSIRSVVIAGVPNMTRGDADDVGRFLKKSLVLSETPSGAWSFDPSKADELFALCAQNNANIVRNGKSFVEMSERSTDNGTPMLVLLPPNAGAYEAPPAPKPNAPPPIAGFEDDLLEMYKTELLEKRHVIELELEAVAKEQAKRVEKARIAKEITDLEATIETHRRALEALDKR
ncbi:MAG: hypothetical protein WCK01_04500 [Candidatus Uhrbacteria bacterium]